MESRLTVAGNPIYPMLVLVPYGLLATGAIFDAADVLGGPVLLGTVAYWTVIAGVFAGVCAGLAGLVDLRATRDGTRERRLAVTYALLNLAVLLLYVVVLMVRIGSPDRAAGGALLTFELLVLVLAAAGAGSARQLTDRFTAGLPVPDLVRPYLGRRRMPASPAGTRRA
jgi:uncharacterized membrane protein